MKNTLRQVFHSGKFVVGFCVMAALLLTLLIYPIFNPGNPLEGIGLKTFFKPGTYVSLYDATNVPMVYTLNLSDAAQKRLDAILLPTDRETMKEWLVLKGIAEDAIDIENTEDLLALWNNNFDPDIRFDGMTQAKRRTFTRLDAKLEGLLETSDLEVMQENAATQEMEQKMTITGSDYINVSEVANTKILPLGTDNFGRDVLKQLVSAARTSLMMGVLAGTIATLIGLTLGLLAGYVGGIVDDIIMFVNNCFTVIPSFVLLILISYSIGQENRGATTVAIVIGCTSWVWTSRSVRSQVISLRNRDHVNLSKLSGHSMARIIVKDILPYIASYVVMAFILQMSAAILAEAQLSMLSLGPKTTEVPTLGLMMNWAMIYAAHLNNYWWAYYPVLLSIALISFSLNLMNTGLDQVFNPQLRD